jgi:hypothetical protein
VLPQDSALANLLNVTHGWKQIYADDVAVVFVRDGLATTTAGDYLSDLCVDDGCGGETPARQSAGRRRNRFRGSLEWRMF